MRASFEWQIKPAVLSTQLRQVRSTISLITFNGAATTAAGDEEMNNVIEDNGSYRESQKLPCGHAKSLGGQVNSNIILEPEFSSDVNSFLTFFKSVHTSFFYNLHNVQPPSNYGIIKELAEIILLL